MAAFGAFERMVAWRYLRARRQEGFISVIAWFSLLGIMLGVATLIIVMAVMNGFRVELFNRILGLNGHVNVYAAQGLLGDYDRVADIAGRVALVQRAVPQIEAQGLGSANGRAQGVMVRGISLADLMAKPGVGAEGRGLKPGLKRCPGFENPGTSYDDDGAVVGYRLAQSLNLRCGDALTIISPAKATMTPLAPMPAQRKAYVVGTFDVGMYEYDANFVFMPRDDAQMLFRMNDVVTAVEITLGSGDEAEAAKTALQQALPGYRIVTWTDSQGHFYQALEVERIAMFMILTLIVLVAAFNIISSLIMLVKDKTRGIAIMRTMGAPRGSILRIFIMTGSAVGVFGTVMGVGLGVAFAANIESIRQFLQSLTGRTLFDPVIYYLSKLPAVINWSEVYGVIAMALALSFGATLYPAWRAARLDPVEALRNE